MRAIKKRLGKLERAKGGRDPLIIIIENYDEIPLTLEERAVLDVYQERMTQEAKKGAWRLFFDPEKKPRNYYP